LGYKDNGFPSILQKKCYHPNQFMKKAAQGHEMGGEDEWDGLLLTLVGNTADDGRQRCRPRSATQRSAHHWSRFHILVLDLK
jgi:hypothetical protein